MIKINNYQKNAMFMFTFELDRIKCPSYISCGWVRSAYEPHQCQCGTTGEQLGHFSRAFSNTYRSVVKLK